MPKRTLVLVKLSAQGHPGEEGAETARESPQNFAASTSARGQPGGPFSPTIADTCTVDRIVEVSVEADIVTRSTPWAFEDLFPDPQAGSSCGCQSKGKTWKGQQQNQFPQIQ